MRARETYRERLRRQLDDPRLKTTWWIGFAGGVCSFFLVPALLGLIAISNAWLGRVGADSQSGSLQEMALVLLLASAFPINVGFGLYCYLRLKRLGEFPSKKPG